MTELETELDSKFDNLDVEKVLSRIENRGSLVFTRSRCIYQAPEFIQRLPPEKTVEEGSTVTFGCKVVGFPKPTVTWFKDDDVIGPDARAKLEAGDNGVHFLNLNDVSRCDAGKYKLRATNLEGSSASMLYLSVKAKSKNRNRKKKKTRTVACAPLFPAIVEHEAEERRETLESETQPDSPLTHLYSNNVRRSPVVWPTFLGDWAYSGDDVIQHPDDDLDIECEDVFEDLDTPTQKSLTFVSSAYALTHEHADTSCPDALNDANAETCSVEQSENFQSGSLESDEAPLDVVPECLQETPVLCDVNQSVNTDEGVTHVVSETKKHGENVNDVINNNTAFAANGKQSQEKKNTDRNHTGSFDKVPSRELDENEDYVNIDTTAIKIAVNRSYAKGDRTFSVATRRSPSPSVQQRKRFSADMRSNGKPSIGDTSTLQNMNNERLLHRMRQLHYRNTWWWKMFLSRDFRNMEDHVMETILFICGCTFLALYFELPATTFMFDIAVAVFIKIMLGFIFSDAS